MSADGPHVLWFEKVGRGDVAKVGGKNASLGEMVANLGGKGVKVPPGFATTADAYWRYVEANGLKQKITDALAKLAAGKMTLAETGAASIKDMGRIMAALKPAIQGRADMAIVSARVKGRLGA